MSFIDSALTATDSLIGDVLAPYALIASPISSIAYFVPDVTVREVHSDASVVTTNPVEDGTSSSDHIYDPPCTLEIACGFSDSTGGYVGYSQDMYAQFLALKATRQPFDISTNKRLYTSMAFTEIGTVTDAETPYALMLVLRFQQVIISSTSGGDGGSGLDPNAQALPAETTPTQDLGQQSLTQPANAPTFVQYMNLFQ